MVCNRSEESASATNTLPAEALHQLGHGGVAVMEFGGFNNGSQWETLATHRNDETLMKAGQVGTWKISNCSACYSMFRVLMTDINSNRQSYLALSGFELFGTMIRGSTTDPKPQETNVLAVIEVMNNSESNQEAMKDNFKGTYTVPEHMLLDLDIVDVSETEPEKAGDGEL
eukprot:TRINITY_DN1611_c0_g1_i1.p1 TRINITY_DN1611_c0_g1~~TRINITY_DN1611_c0_g1_i1.p1  ORF type:complete len:171 (-),score=11.35 TRINITY_DN1611_c0_g1_i1:241-753(-)